MAFLPAVVAGASAIGGLFGKGKNEYQATPAELMQTVTPQQIAQSNLGAQSGLSQYQDFVNAVQAQGGLQNQSQVYNQLQDVAAGRGPNPAQAMLANATGQNVANQAALMAGQRGANANPALLARLAAQQGAGIQQNAAGQAAALQAQQSLNALSGAGDIAGQQAGQYAQGIANYNQALQNLNAQNLQAAANYNQAQVENVGRASGINAQTAQANANRSAQQAKDIGGAVGTTIPLVYDAFKSKNRDTGNIAGGSAPASRGPVSTISPYAQGGQVKPVGSFYSYMNGGYVGSSLQSGGTVPGKPKVAGRVDTQENDTVHALLSPGEIVLPRSVTKSKDPAVEAAKFVQAILAKSGKRK